MTTPSRVNTSTFLGVFACCHCKNSQPATAITASKNKLTQKETGFLLPDAGGSGKFVVGFASGDGVEDEVGSWVMYPFLIVYLIVDTILYGYDLP